MLKNIFFGLFSLFIGLQFYRPAKNITETPGPHEITATYPVSSEVQGILRRACYDCHSNHTVYPWYAEVQPVRWWLDSHINEGKERLNFSEFGTYSKKRMVDKLNEIIDETEDARMPLPSYTWPHPEARLTPAEIKLLITWAEDLIDEIEN